MAIFILIDFFRRLILILGTVFLLASCYSEYPKFSINVLRDNRLSKDSSYVSFILFSSAKKSAEGLYAFPDGGQPEILYKNASLFSFDLNKDELSKIHDFGNILYSSGRWKSEISYRDSLLILTIAPISGWQWELDNNSNKNFPSLEARMNRIFVFHRLGRSIQLSDTAGVLFRHENDGGKKRKFISLKKRLASIPVLKWGLDVRKIDKRRESQYIGAVIELNGNELYRMAIMEQIIENKDCDDIRSVLDEMQKRKNKLTRYEKTSYEIYSKEEIEKLRAILLRNNCPPVD